MVTFFQKTKKLFLHSLLPILVSLIFVAAVIYAWTEPGSAPPTGNVSAPLNVGGTGQTKEGGLLIANNSLVTTGLIVRYGNVGIGKTGPENKLHIYQSNTNTGYLGGLTIEQASTGDAAMSYLLTGVRRWITGINNADSDKFYIIQNNAGTFSSNGIIIDTTGNVGIGTTALTAKLQIKSEMPAGAGSDSYAVKIKGTTDATVLLLGVMPSGDYAAIDAMEDYISWTTRPLVLQRNGGNVGIGTTNPNTALDINGALSVREMVAPARSPTDQGRIYFDSAENKFKVSENAGAYVDLVGAGGALSGGAADKVAYWTSANSLSNNTNFHWDNTNERLGIGTTGPASKLDINDTGLWRALTVRGSGGTDAVVMGNFGGRATIGAHVGTLNAWAPLTINWDGGGGFGNVLIGGNVGIGTTSPNRKLDVVGQILAKTDDALNEWIEFWPSDSAIIAKSNNPIRLGHATTPDAGGWAERMRIDTAGNVGIGTPIPGQKLEVNGIAQAATFYASTGVSTFDTTTDAGTIEAGKFCLGNGTGCITSWPAGGGTPGGANTHVQYNNSGAFGGDAGFTYSSGGNDLSLGGGGSQAGNFNIKNSVGTTMVSLNSDANSWFNTGNVGIGTTGPGAKLNVYKASTESDGTSLIVQNDRATNNTTAIIRQTAPGGCCPPADIGLVVDIQAQADNDRIANFRYWNSGSPLSRMVIQRNGNVGIGTTIPGEKLRVNGGIRVLGGMSFGGDMGYSFAGGSGDTDGGMFSPADGTLVFATNNAERLRIDSSGYVTMGRALAHGSLTVAGSIEAESINSTTSTDFTLHRRGTNIQWSNILYSTTDWLYWVFCNPGCANKMWLSTDGNLFLAGGKAFAIPHPLDPENKYLIHATVEGPENAVFYRGEGKLVNGESVIFLPDYFEALTRKENRTVQLTPVNGWSPLYVVEQGEGTTIVDGKFIVKTADGGNSSQEFFWEVKAERKDQPPLKVEGPKEEFLP